MKTLRLLFIISLFSNGVFDDTCEVTVSVSMMEGDSVTLHTDTDIQTHDLIEWMFRDKKVLIAIIDREANKTSICNGTDRKFRDRLKLNNQTGDLTIRNIRTGHTVYELQITRGMVKNCKVFSVEGVSPVEMGGIKTVSVMEGDSVILHTDVPDIKKYDVIRWKFQHGNSPLAELKRTNEKISISDDVLDGRFRDRLQLDQNGSLTIRNIRIEQSGLYEVDITSSSRHTIHQSFSVNASGGVKMMSVNKGESVTLHTNVTEIQTYDMILWRFGPGDTRIAEIYKPDSIFSIYNDVLDGRFRDRLKLNDQTGDLTIKNIRTEDSGDYDLKISSSRRSIHRRIKVSVTGAGVSSGVIAGICVSLLLLVIAAAVAVAIYYRHKFFEVKLSVKEGEPVTLHTDVTELNTDDEIEWRFQKTVIATIKRNNVNIDERFRDKLTLRSESGSPTIKATRTSDSGLYTRKLIRGRKTSYKRFRLTVTDSADSVAINQPLMNSDTQQL